jgi:transposase
MGLIDRDDGWRMPDWLWERIEVLLPERPAHPLGCHNPRVADRDAMDAILLVLRTGMQWNALNATGSVTPVRRTGVFRSGSGLGYSTRYGARACWSTTRL